MPKPWQLFTSRASKQRLPEDPDDSDLDTLLDEATGEVVNLAQAADQAADDPARADSLTRFLQGEPEDDDGDLLIPQTTAEIAATRQLGNQRYHTWGMTATRAVSGQVVGVLVRAAAEATGQLASLGPAALNTAHTAAGAMSLHALSARISADAGVYAGRAGELKEAIARVARIRDAKASGQATSIVASVAASAGGPVATAAATTFLIAATASMAVPPVALGFALAGGSAAAGVAISYGAGQVTRRVVEAVSDIDRERIAGVLFSSAQQEIAFNRRVDQERTDADRAEAADRSQLRERPEPVREYAVEALAAIGVARELLVDPSAEHRVVDLIRRFLT